MVHVWCWYRTACIIRKFTACYYLTLWRFKSTKLKHTVYHEHVTRLFTIIFKLDITLYPFAAWWRTIKLLYICTTQYDQRKQNWRWTESTPWSGWRRSHVAGIYSDCSTREIIIPDETNNTLGQHRDFRKYNFPTRKFPYITVCLVCMVFAEAVSNVNQTRKTSRTL